MEQLEIKRNWKPLKGYEGIYDISDYGLIYSHPRKCAKGKYTYGGKHPKGYLVFHLPNNKNKYIHILVYETFVGEVPNGYDVHHINHNRQDNRIENLELIEHKEHSIFHNKTEKHILQYTLNGEFLCEYSSTREAAQKTNSNYCHIINVCNGKRKTHNGFKWKYKGEE